MVSPNADWTGASPTKVESPATGQIVGKGGSEAEGHSIGPISSLSISGLLKGLRRRWLLASSLGVVCATLSGAAAWYYLPPGKYTARALLQVDSAPQSLVFHDVQNRAIFQIFQKTQIALVKSRLVLTAALRPEEVRNLSTIRELEQRGMDEAADWLERELQVDFSVGPEILRIALSGDQPGELKTLVNAVEKSYLTEIVQRDNIDREKYLREMTALSQKFDEEVKQKRKALAILSKPVGTNDLVALAKVREFKEAFLKRTETELMDVRSDLRKLEVEALALPVDASAPPITVSDQTLDDYIRNHPEGKELMARKQRIEAQIRDAEGVLAGHDKNPILQKYKRELQAAEDEMVALRKTAGPRLIKDFHEKGMMEQQANQGRLRQKIAFLKKWEDLLKNDVEAQRKGIEDFGQSSVGIESERASLAQAEETAKIVAHQVDALTVERNAPDRIRRLEDAYVTHPDETKRRLVAAASVGGGALGLVLFVISWCEFRRQRINSVDEVVQRLGIKMIGTVPALPSRRQLQMIGANGTPDYNWQSILTESVDTARTMLLHMARSESLRVVMVTSATGGEGKTSLSSHLAASLARSGRKTLLLDADLRKPAIHRLFGVERSPGLCELLRSEIELAETIQSTPAPGLSLIPAGACDSLALQALAQDNFQRICEKLRAEYDFVVVDSAPVLPVADSLLVGQYVDAVVFSILHDVSRLPKVYAAYQRLQMLGIRMLGAVVSGTHVGSYGTEYQYTRHVVNAIEEES